MLHRVVNNDVIIAIIISADFKSSGIEFVTPEHFSQQVGYMSRPVGYKIPPHVHMNVPREVKLTQEVLYIKSGVVRVDLYTRSQTYLESHILSSGSVILLADGGHGFEMLEDSEIIEIKQGPYSPENDKSHFAGVRSEDILIMG